MKKLVQSVKGTRDFYPELMYIRTWLYQVMKDVSTLFGYEEYEAPMLERVDLYAAKSGEELVNDQAYVFPDRGGDLISLRPELTPSLARMVAQRQRELTFPLRWWSFGPFWRYERPQKGRTREFFQWNIDLIGVNSPEADAELIAICATFMKKVGLTPDQVKIHVNDRRSMESFLASLGFPKERLKSIYHLLDRRDKMTPKEWEEYALSEFCTPEQLKGLISIATDQERWKTAQDLVRLFAALQRLGVSEYVVYDPEVIRGLDYYTGVVFEVFDVEGGRALFGGGHYDNLVSDVGGDPLPGVGFAMGDVMIGLVLERKGLLPSPKTLPAQVLVTVFDENALLDAYALSTRLREAGVPVVCYPEPVKLPKQLKFADRIGVRWVIIEGPDEKKDGTVVVKDLRERTQEKVGSGGIVQYLKQKLA
ncbi:MAG TPA: histidine--tRNA ligase [Anaerolineaceae bacterium]